MAGNCKPNVIGLGSEASHINMGYSFRYVTSTIGGLFDGI
ncbi:Hypothetical protein CLAU_1068 [Clostridium autoethanogenum DSM 10061]|nr:Hypothetical protein CLAU_1068 [Clostridium autoethanogenum DSM 10061]OVY52441.1 hypothetical protein WX72_01340 [Clostridium autoethanogenum]